MEHCWLWYSSWANKTDSFSGIPIRSYLFTGTVSQLGALPIYLLTFEKSIQLSFKKSNISTIRKLLVSTVCLLRCRCYFFFFSNLLKGVYYQAWTLNWSLFGISEWKTGENLRHVVETVEWNSRGRTRVAQLGVELPTSNFSSFMLKSWSFGDYVAYR